MLWTQTSERGDKNSGSLQKRDTNVCISSFPLRKELFSINNGSFRAVWVRKGRTSKSKCITAGWNSRGELEMDDLDDREMLMGRNSTRRKRTNTPWWEPATGRNLCATQAGTGTHAPFCSSLSFVPRDYYPAWIVLYAITMNSTTPKGQTLFSFFASWTCRNIEGASWLGADSGWEKWSHLAGVLLFESRRLLEEEFEGVAELRSGSRLAILARVDDLPAARRHEQRAALVTLSKMPLSVKGNQRHTWGFVSPWTESFSHLQNGRWSSQTRLTRSEVHPHKTPD